MTILLGIFIMREDDFVLLKYNEKVHIMVMKNGFSVMKRQQKDIELVTETDSMSFN